MRPTAFCLLENNGRLLLQEFWHEHDHYHFYRPPGGGIEHGELAIDAARREMREELDLDISDLQFLTVLENIFEYGGEIKHEIIFLFRVEVRDERLIHTPEVRILDSSSAFRAVWHPIDELIEGKVVVYPAALQARLREFFRESLSV